MKKNIYLTGHSHIDAVWLWDMKETKEVCKNTFKRILDILDERNDFIYMQSTSQFYKWIEIEEPALFERIKQHVKNGKWELVGGMWVESDCNLPSGESLIRQFLYGQLYYQEKFGKIAETTILPDTFGYAWSLPQIMKKSGIHYFLTSKINWQTSLHFPYVLFHWKGLDGTCLLSYASPTVYVNTRYDDVKRHVKMAAKMQDEIDDIFVPYGEGDHGGGLTHKMIDDVYRKDDKEISVKYCAITDYFEHAKDNYKNLPVYDGELYLKTHRGTYTSQGKIKKFNRVAETKIDKAEKLSFIAQYYGLAYPHALLKEQWEKILFHQFHDDLPGSSINEVYKQDEKEYKEVFKKLDSVIFKAIHEIKKEVKIESDDSIVVFNPHVFPVNEEITIKIPDSFNGQIINDDGKVVSSTVRIEDNEKFIDFYAENLPSLGYKVFKTTHYNDDQNQKPIDYLTGENEFFQYQIDNKTGLLKKLFDKVIKKDLLKGKGMQLMIYEDEIPLESAWNIMLGKRTILTPNNINCIENNHYRTVIQSIYQLSGKSFKCSTIKINIILNKLYKAIDFEIETDWKEEYKTLKIGFDLAVENREYDFEIPYGYISRKVPTDENINAEEKAKWEVPAQKWVSVREGNSRISLLNDCKYGFDTRNSILKVTLLRSAQVPKPLDKTLEKIPKEFTDRGKSFINLRLITTDTHIAEISKKALSFNAKPIGIFSKKQEGRFPSEISFAELNGISTLISAIKKSENGKGMIIRVYENEGQENECLMKIKGTILEAFETDCLENKRKSLKIQSTNQISLNMNPYEIKTIYISGDFKK